MTIDWDKPIETVEGHPARVLSTDYRNCGERLTLIQIEFSNLSGIGWYHQDGEPALASPEIRNRKTKREGWVNVYPAMLEDSARVIVKICESEEAAKAIAGKDVIAFVKIKWEE